MKKILVILLVMAINTSTFADLADRLENLIGYTIIASKKIQGWQDGEGKVGNSFEGCNYGRTIVFSDNTVLSCAGYNYQYAYMPTAIILSNGAQFVMIVEDTVYNMNR